MVYEPGAVHSVNRETDLLERRRGFRSRLRFGRAVEGFSAQLSAGQVRALRAEPDVQGVVPDRPVEARAMVPAAAGELVPTGVRRIGAAGLDWTHEASDAGVAVVDTGVDLQHPDLNAVEGTNCVSAGASADDDDGHGTHVAGTVAARNDGSGVTGVAPGTEITAVKVLDASGSGLDSEIICGLDWVVAHAAERHIRVINMSLGGPSNHNRNCGHATPDPASPVVDPLHSAICRVVAAGLLPVVAAGNDAEDISAGTTAGNPYDTPSSYPEVLTVTAMADGDGAPGGLTAPCRKGDVDDTPASFSNYATAAADIAHTIAAPGVCIRSTWALDQGGQGYSTISGTSMAAPHAAGVAALCIGEAGAPGPCAAMTPAQIVQRLRADAAGFRAARPGGGFAGDPSAPRPGGRYYGYLIRAPGPETTLTAGPPNTTQDPSPSFEFSSTAAEATFECTLDGGPWSACSSPRGFSELPDGAHEFAVRAVDAAGTPDPSPATDSFTVDRPDPPAPPPTPIVTREADATPPEVLYSLTAHQKIATVSRKGIAVAVICSEACALEARAVIAGKEAQRLGLVRHGSDVLAGRKGATLGSAPRRLTIRLTSAVRGRLAAARSALVQIQVVATDAAGNAQTVRRWVRLLR